ncbi:MAG: ABC transporter ATP-binding protein [Alphaproteobacteria bacterium]|nr:ABC transporter ATP-binding protein [Alphaproteobacteria bacterium]
MLKIQNVSKSFGSKKVLDDVCFEVKKGQTAALLGENGAGKSTLLRIISGFLEADIGSVKIDNLDIPEQREQFLQRIGYVKEITSLYDEMMVVEFLRFVADVRLLPAALKDEKIKEVIRQMDLQEVLFQRCSTLSKGFRKRVELAATLLAEPEVLLLDEPTEGLDPNQKHALRQIIKNYAKKHTVMVSTHTLEDVEILADKVLLLHKGMLEADMPLKDFKQLTKKSLLDSFRKVTED